MLINKTSADIKKGDKLIHLGAIHTVIANKTYGHKQCVSVEARDINLRPLDRSFTFHKNETVYISA